MILILMLLLSFAPAEPARIAKVKPCVWPNPCSGTAAPGAVAPVVAKIEPCVWPNPCSGPQAQEPQI